MLIEEAKWFGQRISEMDPSSIFPMCNVGSSTDDFRRREQPWVDEYVFKPARVKRHLVKHLDIKSAPGVDIVGDISDHRFLEELSKMEFRSVFCSNLLEHVPNRESACRALTSLVSSGGYLFVSCPYRFPFHPDPVDTMFRPNLSELAAMFPGTHVHCAETITSGPYVDYVPPLDLVRQIIRLILPFYKPNEWYSIARHVPWLSKRLQATCVILHKNPALIHSGY